MNMGEVIYLLVGQARLSLKAASVVLVLKQPSLQKWSC